MANKRVVSMKVCPGEPTDGSGRVCIHLFLRDNKGRIVEPHVLHPVTKDGVDVKQMVEAHPTRGRLACDRTRKVAPLTIGGVVQITLRTDDPRAVTCPKCKATTEFHTLMTELNKDR